MVRLEARSFFLASLLPHCIPGGCRNFLKKKYYPGLQPGIVHLLVPVDLLLKDNNAPAWGGDFFFKTRRASPACGTQNFGGSEGCNMQSYK